MTQSERTADSQRAAASLRLFDSHCHLNDEQFTADFDEVWARAQEAGVVRVLVPGVDVVSSERAITLADRYDEVFAAVGIHPEAANGVPDRDFDRIEQLAAHPKVAAIGEIGLDYYWDAAPRDEQRDVLRRQIEIARRQSLPVVIHNRDATEDTVHLLEAECRGEVRGVMHCFTGDLPTARRCLDIGFLLSFGGPLTFKNAQPVRDTAAAIPLSSLLVETDAPYLSPHPLRGKRNEPMRVRLVAEALADVKGVDVAVLADTTFANAERLFPRARSAQ